MTHLALPREGEPLGQGVFEPAQFQARRVRVRSAPIRSIGQLSIAAVLVLVVVMG